MPAGMHRTTSSLSSSSVNRVRHPRSDDVQFGVRSHSDSASISSNKSPVRFQIQMKRTPIIQYKSDGTGGRSRHGTAGPQKPATPKDMGAPADFKSVTRTEALKSLSLYASEDSDVEQLNETVSRDKPRDGSKSGNGDNTAAVSVASTKKVDNLPNQRIDLQPKFEDSSQSSNRSDNKERSVVRDTEPRSGRRDRDDSERKRSSLPKERHSSKERETDRYKEVQGDTKSRSKDSRCSKEREMDRYKDRYKEVQGDTKSWSKQRRSSREQETGRYKDIHGDRKSVQDDTKSREYVKSADDRRSDRKSREDEKAKADRSSKRLDCNLKKTHESSSHTVAKIPQALCDTSASRQSNSDRHSDVSSSIKESRKPKADLSPVESSYKVSSTGTRKSPSRADSATSYKKSFENTSRSTNKVIVDKEGSTVKPKPKETEPPKKVDTDLKSVKNDHCQHGDDGKADVKKAVEKLESVDHQEGTLCVEKMATVNDDGRVDNKRHSIAPGGKASLSSVVVNDKKSAAIRKHRSVSSSSSSGSSSGSESSSSGSDSSSSSSTDSSSSSDSSYEEDTATTKDKSSQLKTRQHKDASKSKTHLGPQKPNVHDISEGKSKMDADKKGDAVINKDRSTACKPEPVAIRSKMLDVKVPDSEAPAENFATGVHLGPQKPNVHDSSEDKSKLDADKKDEEIVNKDRSAACKPEPAAVRRKTSDVKVPISEAPAQKISTEIQLGLQEPNVHDISEDKSKLEHDKKDDEIINKDRSAACKPEPVAVGPKLPDVEVPVSEALEPKCLTELYSPSVPTDIDLGWEEEVCTDAARWSSSESDVDDDVPPPPPPPPPPRPPNDTVQPSANANNVDSIGNAGNEQSPIVPKPVTVSSKEDVIALSSSDTSGNSGSTTRSVSDTGKHSDRGCSQKDGLESALRKVGDGGRKSVNDDRKSRASKHNEQSVSGSRNDTEQNRRREDHSRSSHASNKSRSSRSRSRSRERRHHTTKDDGRLQDSVDRRHSLVSDKTSSRQRDIRHSQSPTFHHVASPSSSLVRSSSLWHGHSRRPVQNSSTQQKSSSYSNNRSTTIRQPSGTGNATSKNVLKSDEPVVIIDTDDEDVESLESIPLPVPVPNVQLDEIPLPVPATESSDTNSRDNENSEIHLVENKLDSTPAAEPGEESISENQKSTEEEVGAGEADIDLDGNDESCQNEENNVAIVPAGSQKCPVFPLGKIVLSIGGRTQACRDQNTCKPESSDTANTVAWKRKLAAGLLKAPKLMTLKAESTTDIDSSGDEADENLESVVSTTSEVSQTSDQVAEAKCQVLPEKLSTQVGESSKSGASSSHNAPVVPVVKSNSNGSNTSSTTAVQQKARRRFSDAPPETSANLPADLHSKPCAANVQTVKIEKAYHVLTGQQSRQQHGEDEKKADDSLSMHTECKISADDKSGKLTNQNETTYSVQEKSNSISRTSRPEHKSESSELENPSSSKTSKEPLNLEGNRSKSPVPAKKDTELHRSSTSDAGKSNPSSSKNKVDNTGRERNSSDDDKKKQSSSDRHRNRSPDHRAGSKQQLNISPERGLRTSRERTAKDDSRYLSSRGKHPSPESRLHTSKENDAKDDNGSVRKSPAAWNVDERDVKYKEYRTSRTQSDKVDKDILSAEPVHNRSSRRGSPSDMRHGQDNREIKRSPHPRQSTSDEILVASRREQDEQKLHADLKTASLHHRTDGSRRHDYISINEPHAYQDSLFCGDRDASSRNYEPRNRRSSSHDRVSKPHAVDRQDKSVQNRHFVEKSELSDSHTVRSRKRSPSYDKLAFRREADRSQDRRRSVSKDRRSFSQSRDRSRQKDYSGETFSVDDDRSWKTEKLDRYEGSRRSASRDRDYSRQKIGDYPSERLSVREDDREYSDRRRRESSEGWRYRPPSPASEQLKLPRLAQRSPAPHDRPERSTLWYERSLSREGSPEYRRRQSVIDLIEWSPSIRDAESRLHRFGERSYDRRERSSSKSRHDVSYGRSPSRKVRRSLTPDQGLSTSTIRREPHAQNRRSTSHDRRFAERRESRKSYRSSRSPSQSAIDRRRASPPRSKYSLPEELECSLRRKHSASTERRSRSVERKRRRESSERQSSSRDRRSRSRSRESPSSKRYRNWSNQIEDSPSRQGASPSSRPYREAKHSNRDIVQFLMDTGIIASSKSNSTSSNSGPSVDTAVVKPHVSVVSSSVSVTPVAESVAVATPVAAVSSYPIVPTQPVLPGPIVPQMPYVDNTSVPYMPYNPYPPAFPTPPAGAPNPWYPPPGIQPCNPFPNQVTPVPYPGMQPVPVVPGMVPGPPSAIQECTLLGVHSTPANDWHGSYSQPYNRFSETANQSNFRQNEDHTFKPRPYYGADTKAASSHTGSAGLKKDSGVQPRHSEKTALIRAIADAVWVPTVDSSTPKATHHITKAQSLNLSEDTVDNKAQSENSVTDCSGVIEPAEKMSVCEKTVEQQGISDLSAAGIACPTGCLWECIPEVAVDSKSLAVMEANDEAEHLASESDSKGKKRRRRKSASEGRETRRRSSRLQSKEEQKKMDRVDEATEDQPCDLASKSSISDTEQSKPLVKNLKARILQDYESDTGNLNPASNSTGVTEASLDANMSSNSTTDGMYKIPAESCSPMVTKPEKVKSRWRRWSELESDGEHGRLPPPPPQCQSPSSTIPTTSASEDKDIVEEKPPYFEPILDNIFLSLRLVSHHCSYA